MEIIPTILDKDFYMAETKIGLVKEMARWAQIDVIDGFFTEGRSFELELLSRIPENDQLLWDIHLMVKEPVKWVEKCLFVGAVRVIGQVEMMEDRENFIRTVKDTGMEAGVAFDIGTEVEGIPQETDLVLLMARKSGFGNWITDEKIFEKIKKVRETREKSNLEFKIGVDGGVDENNILKYQEAGVDIVYVGGAIFGGKVEDNFNNLKSKI